MDMKNISYYLLACLLLGSCSKIYEETDNGVIIKVQQKNDTDVQLVRLQVMGDKLVHVSATPESKFADPQSLVVIPQKEQTPFGVEQKGDTVTVVTSELRASVLASTGEVWFTDEEGNMILQENKGGGKTFTPIEVEGTKGYTIRQVFKSPDDEAFYGLGQHQSDEFNYKGKNEELFQYNTKVSVPFIVSNKNYGVLLDSYSLCRFGNPNDYSQLGDVFKLYDKDGKEGAITGTYTLVRREDSLYFEHLVRGDLNHVVNLPEDFPLYGSKVTYEGEIEPSQSGEFKFILYYAGYTKVYIDNKLVVPERWRTAWNPNSYKFSVNLEAGKRVPLKVEWNPDGAVSYSGLRVFSPVDPKEQGKQSWWLDWSHWPENAWGSHEFDKAHFPNPKAMVDSIHAMHGRMMISVWPKFYTTTEHFKEFDEKQPEGLDWQRVHIRLL